MKTYQRSLVLFLMILSSIFVVATVLVPLANATSFFGREASNNNPTTECHVPQDYPTIQAAVDDPTCDLVLVAAGTFVENVVIDRDVTIQGAGMESTIVDGNDNGTVFDIHPGLIVTLTGLTIRNGRSQETPYSQGGGILVANSTLTVVDALITDNAADLGGGILASAGDVLVQNSQIISNTAGIFGGGIAGFPITIRNNVIAFNVANSFGGGVYGHAIVDASIVDHNTADWGGGLYGTLTVTHSFVSNNTANTSGGGLYSIFGVINIAYSSVTSNSATYFGGGIIAATSTTTTIESSNLSGNVAEEGGGAIGFQGNVLRITNSTLSGNLANEGGGINSYSGVVTLNNSTLSTNSADSGGGVFNSGSSVTLTMAGSIIAGNSGGDCSGMIVSQGYNIASDNSCNLNGPSDMNNTAPQLGPLQDNGGPTQTHLPLAGSPAIDTGDPLNCPPTDQRGVPRPYDGDGDGDAVCDIGSVEYSPLLPLSGVTIQGPITGSIQTNYTFTAVVTPITATQPIIYVWQTAGQTPVTHTGGITDTAVFSWNTSGAHALTVTANNSVSSVTANTIVTILEPQYLIYLPMINKP